MQQLHLVGFTTDSDSLILSAKKGAKSGSFVVPLDERMLEVIADAVRRRNAHDGAAPLEAPPELLPPPEPPRRSSLLTPREIQARLRAGRSIADVAREAAIDEEWVSKFAPPVLAERSRIVGRARELVYTRPRRGPSAEPLGLSVRWNLADRGIRLIDDEFDASWSAYFVGDVTWGVTFEFVNRGRRQVAEWEVDFSDPELVARNRIAADLGYVESGRRRRAASLVPEGAEALKRRRSASDDEPASPAPTKRAAPRRRAPARTTAKASKASKTAKAAKKRTPSPTKASKTASRVSQVSKTTRSATSAKTARSAKSIKASARIAKSAPRKTAKTTKAGRATKNAKRAGASKRSPRPRSDDLARTSTAPAASAATPPPPRPAPQGNELSRRRLELIGKQLPSTRAARPRPSTYTSTAPSLPRREARPRPAPPVEPAPEREPPVEVPANETDAAQARREARRQARAERVAQAQAQAQNGRGLDVDEPRARTLPDDSAIPTDEGRVVTIRASRAGTGDVVVPGGPRPLRPALPATQPKRRRFGRNR